MLTRRYILLVMAVIMLPMTAFADKLTAKDSRGVVVSLTSKPRRIVSLIPSTTEILFALGLKGRIVADTALCDYPNEAKKLPHIGDFTTSVEKVMAMHPDLVVGSVNANPAAVRRIEGMKRIPVFTLDANTFDELYTQIVALGKVTGQLREAAALIQNMRGRTDNVKRAVARDKNRPRVLFAVNLHPLWVVGTRCFIDDMIVTAGGVNVTRDAGGGYHSFSLERAVALNPDAIFYSSMRLDALKQPGWSKLKAVERKSAYPMGDEALRPGPRLVMALESMARRLHPKCFAQ